jgi:hypothetical protein
MMDEKPFLSFHHFHFVHQGLGHQVHQARFRAVGLTGGFDTYGQTGASPTGAELCADAGLGGNRPEGDTVPASKPASTIFTGMSAGVSPHWFVTVSFLVSSS